MNNIFNFIGSLLPSFDRKRILDNIAALQVELSTSTLKSFKDASVLISSKRLRSPEALAFDKDFNARLRGNKYPNFVAGIYEIFQTLPDKLHFLESLVSNNYSTDLTRDGLSFQQATVLRYIDVVQFALDYANCLLLNTLTSETAFNLKLAVQDISNQPPATAKWLQTNRLSFLQVVEILAQPLDDVKAKIDAIPNITAAPAKAAVLNETVGASKLDPLRLGFLVTTWMNPIYHARLQIAEWQVARFKALQEQKRALEFRMLALEESYARKSSPKLEQQIKHYEDRLKDANHTLAELAVDYAL